MSGTFRIPLHQLRLKPNIPAGGNGYQLLGRVPMLRQTSEDYDPVLVDDQCAGCGSFRVQDGRHRFMASVLAGRVDILAQLDPGGVHPTSAQPRLF